MVPLLDPDPLDHLRAMPLEIVGQCVVPIARIRTRIRNGPVCHE
jgi:hypothetical protein